MILNKELLKKRISIIMSVLMLFSVIPSGMLTTAFAAFNECLAVEMNSVKVYFYGAETLNTEGDTVTYTGGDETVSAVCINGVEEEETTDVVKGIRSVTFNNDWLSLQSGWIAVKCDSSMNIPADEPTDVAVDKDKPTIGENGITGNPSNWTGDSIILTVAGEDATTDVVFYKIDDGEWQRENRFEIHENGDYRFFVKDRVGNVSDGVILKVDKIDKSAPNISSIAIHPDSWTNKTVKLTVDAFDEGCGLSDTAYKMDDGEWQVSNEFAVNDSQEHTFYVRDKLNHISSAKAKADMHDIVKPVIKSIDVKLGLLTRTPDNYTSARIDYDFYVNATDDKSGIAFYSTDGDKWVSTNKFTMKGAGNYTFYVKDNAGNIQQLNYSLRGDTSAPVIDDISFSNEQPTNQPIIVTVGAHDVDSGLHSEAYKLDDGEWQASNQFEIRDSDEHMIYVRDASDDENESSTSFVCTNFCDGNPQIDHVGLDETAWTNHDITATVHATGTKNSAGKYFDIVSYKMDDGEWQTSNEFTIADCNEHTFYVMDEANNISDEAYLVTAENYDNNQPILAEHKSEKAISFEQKNAGWISGVLNKLSFGRYFNEELVISVNALDVSTDTSNASGIVMAAFEFMDSNKNVYTFDAREIGNKEAADIDFSVKKGDLPKDFKGSASVMLSDAAGNVREIPVTTQNSNMGDMDQDNAFCFMIENTAPVIDRILADASTVAGVYNKDYSVEYNFSDAAENVHNSGLSAVKLEVNGTLVLFKDYSDRFTDRASVRVTTNAAAQTVNNVKIDNWNKGELKYTLTVADNAGNVCTPEERTYFFDQTAPQITGFEFSKADKGFYKDEDFFDNTYEAVSVEEYGFYFKNTVNVTVNAKDIKFENEAVATGVKSISVYLQDAANGKLYTVKANGAAISEIKNMKEIAAVDTGEKLSFVVPQDFKGQIYACASDYAGNTPQACVNITDNNVNENGYVSPDGSIIETEHKHADTSSIVFVSIPKAQGTQNNASVYSYKGDAQKDKQMDYVKNIANQKVPLYNKDISFGVKVSDRYSGIRRVSYTIIEGLKKTVKTVQLDNDGKFVDNHSEGWKIANAKNDLNLVTEMTNSIHITGNYNDMVLLIELTDRAGNKSYDYYVFGIDKTAPAIEVVYDNNSGDSKSGTGTYFKSNRTATITVSERNFNKENVKFAIKNAEGKVPEVKFIKNIKGTKNGDDTKHIFEVLYSTDGVYSFHMNYTDRAANANAPIDYNNAQAPTSFVLDKTKPEIAVTYDNNRAQNSKYFSAYRTATIVVKEHNFDVNRVVITGTAALDGNTISFPSAAWVNNGDIHTATINYHSDGDYTFSIAMDDKAGNAVADSDVSYGSSVAPKAFTVDTSIAKPTISGVENGQSYKDDVIPSIFIDDVNYASSSVQLLRTRKDEINMDVTNRYIINTPANRAAVTEDTFEKIQENDGIYTLNVSVTDLAGNSESDSVTFTVNRFGSVYVFSNDLIALKDAYVKEVTGEIVITEYNPDKLLSDSLRVQITRDGVPVSNVKYAVTPAINHTAEVGSSGWYQYNYVFDNANFTEDGVYTITVTSEDTVGNKPQSTNDSDLIFRVDSTPPEIVSIKGLENKIVNAADQKIEYRIMDAIGLKSIVVTVDNIAQKPITDFENVSNYEGSFIISEGLEHSVRIVITDLAGNETDTSSKAFNPTFEFNNVITVSTNGFIRWYADKPLFAGSIVGAAAAIGFIIFLVVKKKKKGNDDTKPKA